MSRRPAILGGRRWVALAFLVVLALGQAATMIVTAFATRDVFAVLRGGPGAPPLGALAAIAAAGLALCCLRSLETAVGERAGQSYAAAIRRTLFSHMTKMPTSAIARRRSGALALRYVGDLAAFKGWVARGLSRLVSASITIPAAFLILYLLEPMLFWTALGPIALCLAAILRISAPLGTAHSDLRSKRSRLAAAMAERLPQGIALRRSGRMKTELRSLDTRSQEIARAAVRRAWLAGTVRALPDAGSGIAGALCLLVCIRLGLSVADAVAALTALALVVWPLRHVADVTDRRRAFAVASAKLDALLAAPRMETPPKIAPDEGEPAIVMKTVALPGSAPLEATLERSAMRRLAGPGGCGKSTLLLTLAGLEPVPDGGILRVLGADPAALSSGRVLYLGRHAPKLKGSLRREATLGIGRKPDDDEIEAALCRADLEEMAARIGGLRGQVAEGRRNLTASEQVRLSVLRGLLAEPELALVDGDEIGLDDEALALLLDHFEEVGAAVVVVTSQRGAVRRLGPPIEMRLTQHANGRAA